MIENHLAAKLLNLAQMNRKEQSQNKFKYEQGGMLVYDVKANTFKVSESNVLAALPVSVPTKNIEGSELNLGSQVNPEDSEILAKVKQMPACPEFSPCYNLFLPDDNITLIFNSKFESGNLVKAVKLSDYEYNLTIRSDMYSTGNNHWFYFSVLNPRKTSITFKITNMKKDDKLFKLGMQPAVYSTWLFNTQGEGWHREGSSISYKPSTSSGPYFTLSFTYSFKSEGDLVYFAYSVPYTYSTLQDHLEEIRLNHSEIARVDKLCESLTGNKCDMITITSKIKTFISHEDELSECLMSCTGRKMRRMKKNRVNPRYQEDHKAKKGVFFTGRVHSGETVSSFTVKGIVDFLLSSCKRAKLLRERFVFKIVPMLNPDGVRYGNYRCSLLGVDLNRRWDFPVKEQHPTIFYCKKFLQVFNERHPVALFCDFHGHTKKRNVFMYGCSEDNSELSGKRKNMCIKLLPVLMQSNKFFSYKDCTFKVHPSKESTARSVVFKELKVLNSYTLESSFFGPSGESDKTIQMNPKDYASIGESICELLPVFLNDRLFHKKLRIVADFLASQVLPTKLEIVKDLADVDSSASVPDSSEASLWESIPIVDVNEVSDSGGSESEPDERISEVRSKSSVKVRVSNQSLYKPIEKRFKLQDLKPLERPSRYLSINKKLTLVPKIENSRPALEKLPSYKSPVRAVKRVNMLFDSPFRDDLSVRDKSVSKKSAELPKIYTEKKIKSSPKNYNFINYSWVEEYSQSICNSVSQNKSVFLSYKYP